MKRDVVIEPGDQVIIRNFVKVKVKGYTDEWTNDECVDELIYWIYENTHEEGD